MESGLRRCTECKGQVNEQGLAIEENYSSNQSPNVTTDALVLRKHKQDNFHDVLLIKRAYDPFKDHYALPGGFVDYNEDPQDGCLRELKEECNLEGTSIEFFTVKSDPKRDPRKHIVSLVYLVQVSEDAVPKGGDDAKSASFYDLKEILTKPDNLAFDHYQILQELVGKKLTNIYI